MKINDKIYVSRDVELLEEDNIKHILEDEKIQKNVFDLKRTMACCTSFGHSPLTALITTCFWQSYLINNENNSNDLGEIAHLYGDYSVKTDLEVYGKGKSEHVPDDDDELFNHLASKVNAIEKLKPELLKKLKEHEQDALFDTIEIPTARVLARMEMNGDEG